MKRLRDIVQDRFIFALQRSSSVAEAALMMETHNVGIVCVLDGERLVGVFSERDVVRRMVNRGRDPRTTPVGEAMTPDIVVAGLDDDYQTARHAMDQANIRHLPVVDGDRRVTMLSIRDLMRVDVARLPEEVRDLQGYLYQVPS